jgi:uncharacterized membrane protein YwzB
LGDRILFKKERANGCYYVSAYYLSKTLSDIIPLRIIMPLVFGAIVYWYLFSVKIDSDKSHSHSHSQKKVSQRIAWFDDDKEKKRNK